MELFYIRGCLKTNQNIDFETRELIIIFLDYKMILNEKAIN